jgi:hypothetical protein
MRSESFSKRIKKIGSFSLIERVLRRISLSKEYFCNRITHILSAGAMLIFSVSFPANTLVRVIEN